MKKVTFFKNTRYAGGRSHVNITTLKFVDGKDFMQAAEYYGYNLYPSKGEDFENGVSDNQGNEVMNAADYEQFQSTGLGSVSIGSESVFYTTLLKDIDLSDFKELPISLKLEYAQLWNENVTEDHLKFAIKEANESMVFDYGDHEWASVISDYNSILNEE